MSLLLSFAAQCLHAGLMVVAAPTALGALGWVETRLSGRTGVSWRAPWAELSRLRRKQPLQAESASPLAAVAPPLSAAALAVVAALVPSFALGMSLAQLDDLLVVGGLLAMARVVLALASLDEGSATGAVAAWHSIRLILYGEPAVLLAVLALGVLAGTTNLDLIAGLTRAGMLQPAAAAALVAASLAVLAVAQRDAGMPEAECFSGSDLALLRLAEGLRLLVWIDLLGAVFVPMGMASAQDFPVGWLVGLSSWLARLVLGIALLGGLRATAGRLDARRRPALLTLAVLLAALACLLVLTRARPV